MNFYLPNSDLIDGDDNAEVIAIPKRKPTERLKAIMMTMTYSPFQCTSTGFRLLGTKSVLVFFSNQNSNLRVKIINCGI